MKKLLFVFACMAQLLIFNHANAFHNSVSTPYQIDEKLNHKVDMNLEFTDQNGNLQTLHAFLGQEKVLILTLNYYRCKTMCNFQFLNFAKELKEDGFTSGRGYAVASISFDPTDNWQKAKEIHDTWVPHTGNEAAPWSFFVGSESNIEKLTQSLNFYYERDDEGNFSHGADLFFIRRDGTFYRYLNGIVYKKSDVIHALSDTSEGQIGTIFDKFKQLFSHYNIKRGKYFSYFSNDT